MKPGRQCRSRACSSIADRYCAASALLTSRKSPCSSPGMPSCQFMAGRRSGGAGCQPGGPPPDWRRDFGCCAGCEPGGLPLAIPPEVQSISPKGYHDGNTLLQSLLLQAAACGICRAHFRSCFAVLAKMGPMPIFGNDSCCKAVLEHSAGVRHTWSFKACHIAAAHPERPQRFAVLPGGALHRLLPGPMMQGTGFILLILPGA